MEVFPRWLLFVRTVGNLKWRFISPLTRCGHAKAAETPVAKAQCAAYGTSRVR